MAVCKARRTQLVFGQPPRQRIFPGVEVMEEDVEDTPEEEQAQLINVTADSKKRLSVKDEGEGSIASNKENEGERDK